MNRKNLKELVKRYFFINPTGKLRVRDIERKACVPLPSAIRYANELVSEGLLKRTKISGVVFYSADRSSQKFTVEKRLFNIGQLFESGLSSLLKEKYGNPAIVVFGSYAIGEDVEDSDIDIFITSCVKPEADLKPYEKKLHRKIQLFVHESITSVKNRELENSIVNGVIINGSLEVFR